MACMTFVPILGSTVGIEHGRQCCSQIPQADNVFSLIFIVFGCPSVDYRSLASFSDIFLVVLVVHKYFKLGGKRSKASKTCF